MCSGAWFQEQDNTLQNTPSKTCKLISELQGMPEMARVQPWY
jgi:hypothetical protein